MRMTLQGVDDVMKRLGSTMPVRLDYVDPFTNTPVVLYKEDVLRLMVIDVHDPIADSQILPALLVEFSRAQRACEFSKQYAEGQYRQWKSALSNKAREKAAADGTKFTEAMGEAAYRTHKDYAKMSAEPARWELFGNLFSDLKEAVQLKGQVLNGQLRNLITHERLTQTANGR